MIGLNERGEELLRYERYPLYIMIAVTPSKEYKIEYGSIGFPPDIVEIVSHDDARAKIFQWRREGYMYENPYDRAISEGTNSFFDDIRDARDWVKV